MKPDGATRRALLAALADGRSLPIGRLCAEAGLSPATGRGHLDNLVADGRLRTEQHGRYRYYRLAAAAGADSVSVGVAVAEAASASGQPVRSLTPGTAAHAVRQARTCYDHLAGRLGVALMTSWCRHGWLAEAALDAGAAGRIAPRVGDRVSSSRWGREVDYRLTPAGRAFAEDFGIRIPPRRSVVRYCIDWTEERHHLAGGLGAGLSDRLLELAWIERLAGTRAVTVTAAGRAGLRRSFDLD